MPTLEEQIQELLTSQQAPVLPTLPRGTPDDGTRPGLLGRIGEVLAGGQSPTYRLGGREADAAGSRALLNFGLNMLMASGPQRVRPDLGSVFASGLQGAQQSMDLDQRRAAAVAQQDYAQRMDLAKLGVEQNRDKIERLKAMLPLLTLQQQEKQRQAYLSGNTGDTGGGGAGGGAARQFTGDLEKDRQLIKGWESGGDPTALNYVAKADPSARAKGATASGLYGFVDSTWQEGLKMIGGDAAKYPTAASAPERVQDDVFTAVYKARGTAPWDPSKWGQNWVKNASGGYDLVKTGTGGAGGTTTPPPYKVTTTGTTPPPPTGAPAVTPAVLGATQPAPTGATSAPDAAAPAQPAVPGQPPAPGGGQAAIPNYTRPHPFEPTLAVPPDDPRFATVLPQPVEEDFRRRLQLNESQMRTRIATAPAADLDKIVGEHDKLKQDILKDRTAALGAVLKEQGTSVGAWQKEERDRLFQVWKDERYPAEPSDLEAAKITPQPGVIYQVDNQGNIHQQKVEVDPRLQRQAEQDYKTFQDNYQQPYTQLIKIRPVMDQMDALRQRIIRNGGGATGLSGEHLRQVQQVAASLGFSSENFGNLNDVQVLESLANQVVLAMKQGVALGNVSNLDLQIVGSQVPTMMQTLSGQEKLSSVLRQIWDYQEKVYKVANKEIRNPGTGYTLRDLDQKVAEAGPAIPLLPAESEKWDKKQFEDWRTQHKLRKGQVYYTPDGQIATVTK
jgi:hypothetical protein